MTPDEFKTLCSRREGAFLDFKECFYENSDSGNAELAKDIMSIGNGLGLQASGHLLFGVREESDGTGLIVGCELEDWVTDANLQQKVRSILNRVPRFSPGGRPFFALRDRSSLRRHQALVRVGSSSDVASPDEILDWARQDEALGVRALEAEHLETQQILKPCLLYASRSQSGEQYGFAFRLQNDGLAPFQPVSAILRWKPIVDHLRSMLATSHIRLLSCPPDFDKELAIDDRTVQSRAYCDLQFAVLRDRTASELFEILRPFLEGEVAADVDAIQFLPAFASTVIVKCRNLIGTRETIASAPLPALA
jgi:hypothetical protein